MLFVDPRPKTTVVETTFFADGELFASFVDKGFSEVFDDLWGLPERFLRILNDSGNLQENFFTILEDFHRFTWFSLALPWIFMTKAFLWIPAPRFSQSVPWPHFSIFPIQNLNLFSSFIETLQQYVRFDCMTL